jgi:hypothetical protein
MKGFKWVAWGFALLVAMLPAHATQASSAQAIQEMRSLGFSVCANILVYFNENGSPYELRNKQAYLQGMTRLQSLAASQRLEDVSAELSRLQSSVADTAELPQSEVELRRTSPGYTRWLLPVVDSHARLQELLDAHYRRIDNAEELQSSLHALSRDIGQLLLGYQIASFSRLGAEQWVMSAQQVLDQDQRVLDSFTGLSSLNPAVEKQLADPARQYAFSREQLFNQSGRWMPNGVGRYLGMAMLKIDQAAIELTK